MTRYDRTGISRMAKTIDEKKSITTFTRDDVETLAHHFNMTFNTTADIVAILDYVSAGKNIDPVYADLARRVKRVLKEVTSSETEEPLVKIDPDLINCILKKNK